MLTFRYRGLVVSLISFAVSFILTNYLLKVLIYRKPHSPTFDEQLDTELKWRYLPLDSRTINAAHPRDEFVYTLQPWKVMQNIANESFVCQETKTYANPIKVIVMVKSAVDYVDRRNNIRETWGRISHLENFVLHVVFITGMAVGESQKKLEEESAKEGDLLQFIGVDDYRHIAYKVLAGMQWARDNIPWTMLYSSADDDLMPDLPRLVKYLRKHVRWAEEQNPPSNPHSNYHLPILCTYAYRKKTRPVRKKDGKVSKYYLDPREFPSAFLPPFCLGGWYLMNYPRVKKLYAASRVEKALYMDDVWITGILRLKVHPNTIEPIDPFQKRFGFGLVEHFEGGFQEEKDINKLMRQSWNNVWNKESQNLHHCTRR